MDSFAEAQRYVKKLRNIFLIALFFEIVLHLAVGFLAKRCFENSAMLLSIFSIPFAAFFLFHPKVIFPVAIADFLTYLSERIDRSIRIGDKSYLWLYSRIAMLITILHSVTIMRAAVISPLFVADEQMTAATTAAGALFAYYRIQSIGLEKTLVNYAISTSVLIIVVSMLSTIPPNNILGAAIYNWKSHVCAARGFGL